MFGTIFSIEKLPNLVAKKFKKALKFGFVHDW